MMKRMGLAALAAFVVLFIYTGVFTAAAESADYNVSQFAPEISALVYHPVNYTDQALELSWDFSAEEVYSFQYDQAINMTSDMGFIKKDSGPEQMMSTVSGDMLVKSLGNNFARVIFENMEQTMEVQTPEGPDQMSQKLPIRVLGEISHKGRSDESVAPEKQVMYDIFPLPDGPLRSGETVVRPIKVPFNAMGSMLYANGEERITLTGFVSRDSRLCAQLDVVQEVKDLNVPSEIEGDYFFSKVLISRAFFDIKRKHFVEVLASGKMIIEASSPRPDVSFGENKGLEDEIPKVIEMSMDSDNLIHIVAE